jgi:RNA polymerase sigma factor (sigma-70 family)
VRVTTRLAIDRLRRAKARRESYVGPWLPEPVLTAPDVAEDVAFAESVSMAMLVVLETLSPLERAVFVLREAFGMPYAEIAEILGRKEEAVRPARMPRPRACPGTQVPIRSRPDRPATGDRTVP